jgi:hypothetical protein
MKKIIFALVVLLLASPAWAEVVITCANSVDGNDAIVTVSYDATSEANLVRAIALEITLSGDGEFGDVNCLSKDFGYHIYLGSIDIDSEGTVQSWGSCQCDGSYPETPDDANHMTVEMASLYEAGVEEEPCKEGDLVSFVVTGTVESCVSIQVNEIRGAVVMENASEPVDVNTEGTCCVDLTIPTCWDATECGAQALGDGTCNGDINFLDLGQLKQAIFTNKGDLNYNCCADYNHDEACNFLDLGILKQHIFETGHTPATLNQNCPP